MSRRIVPLALCLLFAATLSLAAEPVKPLPTAPAVATAGEAAALPWLAPAADQTPAVRPGAAPQGAIFERACGTACQACQARCAASGGDSCCYWRCDRVGPNPC